jgi:hypothetical protein
MRQLNAFYFLFILTVLLWNCGNPGRNVTNYSGNSKSVADTMSKMNKPILAPLEAGEIHVTDDAFGTTINQIGEPLNIKENTKPVQLLVKDKYLVTNNQRNDSIFMIFELPDFKCIAAFGRSGRGPDEFGFPTIVETAEDSILFYIYEQTNEKVYKVTINYLKPEYYLTLPKQNRSFGDKQIVFFDNNTAYYSSSAPKGKMIYLFNKDSLPQEKKFKDLAISGIKGSWTTFIGDFGTNKDLGRIVYAYKYFKRLKIIDIHTMKEREIVFDAMELAKGQSDIATLEPTNITHYWGMSPNVGYFYMLYSGRTPVDVMRDNRNKKKYIFVEKYDWTGNPIKRYKLDDWGYFCVDEKRNTLYLASTASIYSLIKYHISDSGRLAN